MPLADIILVIMGMLTVAMLVAAACRNGVRTRRNHGYIDTHTAT